MGWPASQSPAQTPMQSLHPWDPPNPIPFDHQPNPQSVALLPHSQVKFIQRKHRYLLGRVESYRNQERGVVGGPTTEEKGVLGTTPGRPPDLRWEEMDFNKRATNLIIFPLSPWLAAGLSGFWPFPSRYIPFKITSCMHACIAH